MIRALVILLRELMFPRSCCHCHAIGWYLCPKCQLLCEFAQSTPLLWAESNLHSMTAAFAFTPPISEVIKMLKYRSVSRIADWLGAVLYFHTNYPDVDVVTSVPVTAEKRRLRGFNQAERIARSFARHAKLPYRELLSKTATRSVNQASISDRRERAKNAHRHIYHCLSPPPLPARILLIDDVFTTGQTLDACAAKLRQHGAVEIHGLVVAHGR